MELKSITFPGLDGKYSIPQTAGGGGGLTAEEVQDMIGAAHASHATDKNNPHGVTASQVGARPNTWTPSASDVGAAPSGYGYGDGLVSIASADDDATFTAALSAQFAKTRNNTRQITFTKGGVAFVGELWNANNGYGVLVANSYVEPNVAYRFKQLVRICNNGTWGDWVDNSPTAFAPSGTGYEKKPIALSKAKITSEAELTNAVESVYSKMTSKETRLVYFFGYPSTADFPFFGMLSKSSDNFGSLIVHTSYDNGTLWQKTKVRGTWQDIKQQATSMELLWENASPSSEFAAQTVSLALSSYDAVEVEFGYSVDYPNDSHIVRASIGHGGGSHFLSNTNNNYGYLLAIQRGFSVYESSIYFADASFKYSNEKAFSTKNDYVIPTRIYGIKF